MEVRIRQAGAIDATALAELAAITFPLASPADSPEEDVSAFIAANLGAASFLKYLSDSQRVLFVAEEVSGDLAGRLVAYAMLVDAPPSDPDVASVVTHSDAVELSKCYAHPAVHGGGVAAKIMRASLAWVAQHGNRTTWLGVNNENVRAQTFYGKHGFSIAGTRSFQLGTRVEHDFVMVRPPGKTITG
ncbi:Ribosomal protein S18 acetylase RimI [Arthrobacter alpinus]|uniref:Ribosomal protein S18 acetylase RimI n=1 Tax=Arthrobacter alpinus TaxID=656366 RepID=A0A1H5NK33_9MICC|nr:N-acetyltransferase [Arthrobacter alpinus]SEF01068.1 Ribosomal protein S18 acetylase RimI [Arthrobacter alpinus]